LRRSQLSYFKDGDGRGKVGCENIGNYFLKKKEPRPLIKYMRKNGSRTSGVGAYLTQLGKKRRGANENVEKERTGEIPSVIWV